MKPIESKAEYIPQEEVTMGRFKHGTKEYWMDWYWNKGGREKVQERRKERGKLNFKHRKFE